MTDLHALIRDPAHDCYYCVDAGMVQSYLDDDIPGWRAYVDRLGARGKRFFVTPRTLERLPAGLPPHFFLIDGDNLDRVMGRAYAMVKEHLPLASDDHAAFVKWILECRYHLVGHGDIPDEAIYASGMVMAITANCDAVQEIMGTAAKRATLEDVVNLKGLEHLVELRCVRPSDGSFVELD